MPKRLQEVTITCPSGHRLGRVNVRFTSAGPRPALEAQASTTAGPDGLTFDTGRGKLVGVCPFCPARDNAWTVPARSLAGVLAAMLAYGPQPLTVPITGLRLTLHRLIPDGDPDSVHRRKWFGQMLTNLDDTHST